MSLIGKLLGGMGFGDEITPCAFRYTVVGRGTAVIEGVGLGVASFTENRIVFSVKGGYIAVDGANLCVYSLSDGEATVKGDITGVCLS